MAARLKRVGPKSGGRWSVRDVVALLGEHAEPRRREAMGRQFGISGKVASTAMGVPMTAVRAVARQVGTDHKLARLLWKSGGFDARALAPFVADPKQTTAAMMNTWARGFDNWATCDTACFVLFDKVDPAIALGRIKAWAICDGVKEEFVKRGAFALLASLALHDRTLADREFAALFPLIRRAAADERNFVKKGVSWALRSVGHRSPDLLRRSMALARTLTASDSAASRWVGRDALADLRRPLVARRAELRQGRRSKSVGGPCGRRKVGTAGSGGSNV